MFQNYKHYNETNNRKTKEKKVVRDLRVTTNYSKAILKIILLESVKNP